MPLVEYKCQRCNYSFAKLVLGSGEESVTCPNCQQQQIGWRLNYTTLFKNRGSSTEQPEIDPTSS